MNTAAVTRGSAAHPTEKPWKSSGHKPGEAVGSEAIIFSGVLKQCLESPPADQAHNKETMNTSEESTRALRDELKSSRFDSGEAPGAVIQTGLMNVSVPGDKTAQENAAALHRLAKEGILLDGVMATAQVPGSELASSSTLTSTPDAELTRGSPFAAGTITAEGDVIFKDLQRGEAAGQEPENLHLTGNALAEKANRLSVTSSSQLEPEAQAGFEKRTAALLNQETEISEDEISKLKPLRSEAKNILDPEFHLQTGKSLSGLTSDPAKSQSGEVASNAQQKTDPQHPAEPFLPSLAAKEPFQADRASDSKSAQTETAAVVPALSGTRTENEVALPTVPRAVNIPELPELLAQQAQLMKAGETKSLRMMLNPEHLGALEIELSLKNGILTGVISIESELAHELLQKQLPQFLSTLDSRQIPAGTFEMHYRGENGGFSNHGRKDSEGSHKTSYGTKAEMNLEHSLPSGVQAPQHKGLDLLA